MVDIAGAIGPLYGVAATIPIAVRTSLTSATLRDLITIARYRSVHWVSIASAESADVAVRDLVRDPDGRTAQLIILDRLTRDLSPSVSGIVETATLLTHRRVSVSTLAGACGLAVRTVEWRLSSAHLPSAHTILGWMGALHSVWQLDVLGWTHKRVAREAGFGTVELCDVSIQRHTGARLLQICRAYGLDRLLDRVGVALLQRGPHSPSLILFPRLARSAPNRSCAPNRESRSQGRALCP